MTAFVIGDEEWDRLYNEPAEVLKIYCALRRVMDFTTGFAGFVTHINEAFFFEALLIERIRGRTGVTPPTRKQWRNILVRLEKLKLIEPYGNFVFRLPFALTDSLVQNNRGQSWAKQGERSGLNSGQTGWHDEPNKINGFDGLEGENSGQVLEVSDSDEDPNRGLPPVSEVRDEMIRAREVIHNDRAGGDAGRAPAAQSATRWNVAASSLVLALRRALGPDYRLGSAFVKAAEELEWVAAERCAEGVTPVTAQEVSLAVDEARSRGIAISALASYSAKIVRSRSLILDALGGNAVPFRTHGAGRPKRKVHPASPGGPRPWFLQASGIEARAEELGFVPPADVPLGVWRFDVYKLAGVTEEDYRRACVDFGVRERFG